MLQAKYPDFRISIISEIFKPLMIKRITKLLYSLPYKIENNMREIHRNIHTYSPVHIKNSNWYVYGLVVLKLWIKSGQSRNCPNWDSLMLNYSLQKPDFTVTSHNSYLRYLSNGKLILNVDKQFVAFFVKKMFFFDRSIFISPKMR